MTDSAHIIRPPFDWHIKDEGKLVYLVGPYKDQWQDAATKLLFDKDPTLYIANPTNAEWPTTEELQARMSTDNHSYVQSEWQTSHIRTASKTGALLFWFPGNEDVVFSNPSTTARALFNFGEWFTHKKYRTLMNDERPLRLAIGIDDAFAEKDYLLYRIFNDAPKTIVATTLEETCGLMIEELK